MNRHYLITLTLLFVAALNPAWATTDYTAFNYNRTNGFPGNKIYCNYQDAKGYIWIGTENGLVSFNGYAFRSYTIRDGLPDNEVLTVSEDASGKLWVLTFSNELCYLWKGKIYNNTNDSLLSRLKLVAMPSSISFDKQGNKWITETVTGDIIRVSPRDEITRISRIGSDPFQPITTLAIGHDGKPFIINEPRVYRYDNDRFQLVATLPPHPAYHYTHFRFLLVMTEELTFTPLSAFLKQYASGKNRYWIGKDLVQINAVKKLSPELMGVCTQNGLYLKDYVTGQTNEQFLNNYNVSTCMIAKDGSLWCGTLGNGIFHYTRSFIRSIPPSPGNPSILFAKSRGDHLDFIDGGRMLTRLPFNGPEPLKAIKRAINEKPGTDVFSYIGQDRSHNWITCSSPGFTAKQLQLGMPPVLTYNIGLSKCTVEEEDGNLLIGTIEGIFRLDKDKFSVTEVLPYQRVTSMTKLNNNIYAGTFSGLIEIGATSYEKIIPLPKVILKGHITAVCADGDSLLWAADNKAGLTLIRNGHIAGHIDGSNGLGCNSISSIKASTRFLWLGTDNGLYAVQKTYPFHVIKHLSYANGLYSDQVNCLEIGGGCIWVGTDKGLNYFEEKEIVPLITKPSFIINSIRNDERYLSPASEAMVLDRKTLQIDFDVIDHSGITRPAYTYRINNNEWLASQNDNLYFPTTPFGKFTISIRASSANWDMPKVITLSFYRVYPFYLTWWFLLLAGLLLLLLVAAIAGLLLRRARKKDQGKLLVQQNLLQLEQMALQGQMNPHFIFNCIAAIRQYYNEGDVKKANRIVDAFSALIRTTFEMASQTFTTLEKELQYLTDYLTIEQERFDHSFRFAVNQNVSQPAASIPVPAMLLQPLVENAVRHGVRHLPDGTGRISILILQQDDTINITIEDNGIGRARAQQMKQSLPTPVTSTSVNKKRIDILNKLFGPRISMHTEDVPGSNGTVGGTRIFISYPINIYDFGE